MIAIFIAVAAVSQVYAPPPASPVAPLVASPVASPVAPPVASPVAPPVTPPTSPSPPVPVPPAPPAAAGPIPAGCAFATNILPPGDQCAWSAAANRYVCPLPSRSNAVLPAQTVYVATGTVATNVTLGNETALVAFDSAVVDGEIVVAGDGVALCGVWTTHRVVVAGSSARGLVVDDLSVDDTVGLVVKGASPKINSIDVTGLTVTRLWGPAVIVAAAHAQADAPVTIPCDPNNTVILQPLVPNANITASPGCQIIDLSRLLNVFGRPYEASAAPRAAVAAQPRAHDLPQP